MCCCMTDVSRFHARSDIVMAWHLKLDVNWLDPFHFRIQTSISKCGSVREAYGLISL